MPTATEPAPNDQWQLLYWNSHKEGKVFAGAGRGEYLRILFEATGQDYEEVNEGISEYCWQKADELQPAGYPVLAPPVVRYNNFAVAQTAVAAKYVAMKLGLYPTTASPEAQARAEQIVATVHEYIAEGRMAFHPVKNTMSYHGQAEEAKPFIAAFVSDRLPRYMDHFERQLAATTAGNFFMGDSLTYVDLQVLVMLQVTTAQWPGDFASLSIPRLKAFRDRVEALPRIRAYLDSGRRKPFAGNSLM